MISIVLPTFNDGENKYLKLNLKVLDAIYGIEVIAVDSESCDDTVEILNKYSRINVFSISSQTRAARISRGLSEASGSMILIIHPRNEICAEMIEYLAKNANEKMWGGFKHKFDNDHFFLKYISWYSNNVRVKLKNIVYLDHCTYLHKDFIKHINLPEVPIFEDTILSQQLRKVAKARFVNIVTTTSAVRFEKSGIYNQYFKNQLMKILFDLGVSCYTLNKMYEKKLMLNTGYGKKS